MKPVNQTRFGNGSGNCFAACIASILEVPIEEMNPLLTGDGSEGWLDALQAHLRRSGMFVLSICIKNATGGISAIPDGLVIVSGPNMSGGCQHAVICRVINGSMFELVHDPGGKHQGIQAVDYIWLFCQLHEPIPLLQDSPG